LKHETTIILETLTNAILKKYSNFFLIDYKKCLNLLLSIKSLRTLTQCEATQKHEYGSLKGVILPQFHHVCYLKQVNIINQ